MDIFESLENLNVSEECFDEIMGIVETLVGKWKEKGYPADKGAKDHMKVALYPKEIEKNLAQAKSAAKEHQELLKQKDKEGRFTADFGDIMAASMTAGLSKIRASQLKKDMEDAQKRLNTQDKYKREAIMNAKMRKEGK